jgi:hypothetical protein
MRLFYYSGVRALTRAGSRARHGRASAARARPRARRAGRRDRCMMRVTRRGQTRTSRSASPGRSRRTRLPPSLEKVATRTSDVSEGATARAASRRADGRPLHSRRGLSRRDGEVRRRERFARQAACRRPTSNRSNTVVADGVERPGRGLRPSRRTSKSASTWAASRTPRESRTTRSGSSSGNLNDTTAARARHHAGDLVDGA